MKSFSLSRKFWIAIITVMVIGLGFFYYFLIYVKNNEERIIQKSFRVLSLISRNVNERYSGFANQIISLGRETKRAGPLYYQSNPVLRDPKDVELTTLGWMIPAHELIEPVRRADVFQDLLVFRVDNSLKDSLEKQDNRAEIVYQTMKGDVRMDSLHYLMQGRQDADLGHVGDLRIMEEDYKTFPFRMQLTAGSGKTESWIILGLINSKVFNQRAMRVEPWIAYNSLLVLFLVLIAMPLLKLKFMGPIERIYASNVVTTGISVVAGTATLVLIIISYFDYRAIQRETDKQLGILANKIQAGFEDEVSGIIETMRKVDPKYSSIHTALHVEPGNRVWPLGKTDPLEASPDSIKREIRDLIPLSTDNLIWLDSAGEQLLHVLPEQSDKNPNDPIQNLILRQRPYFMKIVEGQTWRLSGDSVTKEDFALQSIRSWTGGETEAVVSIRSGPASTDERGPKVVVTATQLHTVMNPVLPPGYGLCIIDDQGMTWFHSDSQKNMDENFIHETDDDEALKSALRGRTSSLLRLTYHDEETRAHIRPIDGLPLYAIVYLTSAHNKTPIILSAASSFLPYLTLFGVLGIQLLVLFLTTRQSSKLKIGRFYLGWLRPHSDHQSVAIYRQIIFFNICVLALLVLYKALLSLRGWDTPDIILTLLFLTAPNLFLGIYLVLTNHRHGNEKKYFVSFSLTGIALVHVVLANQLLEIAVVILYQLFFWAIYFALFPSCRPFFVGSSGAAEWAGRLTGRIALLRHPLRTFSIMLFSWLFVVSILCPIYFHRIGYDHEREIWTRYNQWETARSLDVKRSQNAAGPNISDTKNRPGEYLVFITETDWESPPVDREDKESDILRYLARPHINTITAETGSVAHGNASDGVWYWRKGDDSNIRFFREFNDWKIALSTSIEQLERLGRYSWHQWGLLGTLAFLLCLGWYHTIHFSVRRIFAFDLLDHPTPAPLSAVVLDQVEKSCNIFVVGLPFSGKRKLLKGYQQYLNEKQIDCLEWSFCNVNDPAKCKAVLDSKQPVVLIRDFEFAINDHATGRNKLQLLESLMQFRERQIVISSTIRPESVVMFYDAMVKRTEPFKYDAEFKNDYQEFRMAAKRWKHALSSFVTLYQPLDRPVQKGWSEGLPQRIARELDHGTFLQKLAPEVKKYCDRVASTRRNGAELSRELEEEVILMIQRYCQTYYQSIWVSLTAEERFILFDLAKDRLVNPKNSNVLRGLMDLGIIHGGRSLKLANRSLNNFILCAVSPEEERQMEKYLRKTGSWSAIHMVLVIGMIGLLSFIALGQKEFLTSINGFITTVVGISGLLLRLVGLASTTDSPR